MDILFKMHTLKTTIIRLLIIFAFITQTIFVPGVSLAQTSLGLYMPAPGTMVTQSSAYQPIIIKGVTINANNPFQFDFIVDTGDSQLTGYDLKDASEKLIKYFMTSLTIPEKELWVNLSPYENDRIIPQNFGYTEMGRDLLTQDYVLKELTSSLINPEKELGEKFWDNVYTRIYEDYCQADTPSSLGKDCHMESLNVDTFNKVWVVPDKAVVYEHGQTAFVAESYLKVLLESDYEAMRQYQKGTEPLQTHAKEKDPRLAAITSKIVKEIILPAIEKEVNEGKHFSRLRQITNSLILAAWYKKRLKESVLSQLYVDKGKVNGVDVLDRNIKNKIYNQYLEAFTKGVFNLVKEEYNPVTQQVIPRKYFSGGKDYTHISDKLDIEEDLAMISKKGQDEITKTLNRAQNTTDVFTVEANFEIDNTLMPANAYQKLVSNAQQLVQTDFNNKPMSAFVDWIDQTMNSVQSEISLDQFNALAEQLGISKSLTQRVLSKSNALANSASNFAKSIPHDGKMNVFLMRDAFSLYAASKVQGDKAYALYLSKATFKMFSEERMMSDLIIPMMILEIKQNMGIANREVVAPGQFPEFKNRFFGLLEELASDKETIKISDGNQSLLRYRDNIKNAINGSIQYLKLLGITTDKIAHDGIRFIDTTKTGSFVLFLEGVSRLMLKQTELAPEAIQEKTDGKMFYSDLSPAFSYREDSRLSDAREIESTFYPVTFARELSEEGEPLINAADFNGNDQKLFLLQLVLLQSELLRIQKENTRQATEAKRAAEQPAARTSNDDQGITTFDKARETLVTDIYKKVNASPLTLTGERIETPEGLKRYLEKSSYIWQTAHESKKRNLLGVLGVLQKYLIKFLEREFPGINIKSVNIGGSLAEFWASYPEDARMPYGEDIDVYVVADREQPGSLKIPLARFFEGQAITEELDEFSVYGVKEFDVWINKEGNTDVDFYMLYGSGVTIWGNPIKTITSDQTDPLMIMGRVERLIGPNAWDMTGRLVVANWLLRGVAQRLGISYEEYSEDINAHKAAAREVIQRNYEQIMIALANKKINALSEKPNEDLAVTTGPKTEKKNVGGIDLNPESMNLEIKTTGEAVSVPVNLDQIETLTIDGLIPVIFNISPTTNLQPLLGLNK